MAKSMLMNCGASTSASPYPSQSRLDACLEQGNLDEARNIALQRLQLHPDDNEAWAIYNSLVDTVGPPLTATPPPVLRPSAPSLFDISKAQAADTADLNNSVVSLIHAQEEGHALLERALLLAFIEAQAPVVPLASKTAQWLQSMLLPTPVTQTTAVTTTPLTHLEAHANEPAFTELAREIWQASYGQELQPRSVTTAQDDLGKPLWLLAAQQQLVAQVWELHDAFRPMQRLLSKTSNIAPICRQFLALDIRHPLERELLDLQQRWHAKAPVNTQDLWRQSAEEDLMLEKLLELANVQTYRLQELCLSAPLKTAPTALVALFSRAAIIQKRSDDAQKLLENYLLQHPKSMQVRLSLFSLRLVQNQVSQAHTLFEDGHMQAVADATVLWGGRGPFPSYLHETLSRLFLGEINNLLNFIGQIAVKPGLKRMLWLAAVELLLGSAQAVTAHKRQTMQVFCCCICNDDKLPQEDAALVNCRCNTKVCLDCAGQSVRHAEARRILDRCSTGCGNLLTRQDLERMGFDQNAVMQRLTRVVGHLLATESHWTPCKSPDCTGGYKVTDRSRFAFTCSLCTQENKSAPENDPLLVRNLLLGVLHKGFFRECPNCGTAIEKNDGCDHMRCRCSHNWNFGNFYPEPKRPGVLSKLGFYKGLKDTEQGTIEQRARDWLKRYPG